jgi:SagB-type dehydrogenase family enzyme
MGEARGLTLLAEARVGEKVALSPPAQRGAMSVEEAIHARRSVRQFAPTLLGLGEIGQLLWSAQGVTSSDGRRAAPSAGASYPLEVYAACEQGLFHYLPAEHALRKTLGEDVRAALARDGGADVFVARAPLVVVLTADYARTTGRYGDRGVRYVHIDLGHAAENLHLQAEALGLASVAVGAFSDAAVARVLRLPADEKPVYIIPVGHRA